MQQPADLPYRASINKNANEAASIEMIPMLLTRTSATAAIGGYKYS